MSLRMFPLAVALLAAGVAGAADITVRPLRVTEYRAITMTEKKGPFEAGPPTVNILLELKGKSIVTASKFGEINVTAKTAKGPLKQVTQRGLVDISKEYEMLDDFYGENEEAPDRTLIEILFEAPPREAASITSVEGSLKLLAGESQEVELAGVVGKPGKVAHKMLTEAGLTVTVVTPVKEQVENAAHALAFDIEGDLTKLADVWLVDAKGEEINASVGTSGDDAGKKKTFVLEGDNPLPKDAKLMMEVVPKLEKITVPIKLSNLKLP